MAVSLACLRGHPALDLHFWPGPSYLFLLDPSCFSEAPRTSQGSLFCKASQQMKVGSRGDWI